MFPIRWNEIFRKKDGTLGTMEDAGGGGGSALPEYDSSDAGKVLGVDDDGLLEWEELPSGGAKIYYKIWDKTIINDNVIAKFDAGSAASSGIHIAKFDSDYSRDSITVNGYTPIGAIAVDVSTGYRYMLGIQQMGATAEYGYQVSYIIGSRTLTNGGIKVKVYYVKNEDLNILP